MRKVARGLRRLGLKLDRIVTSPLPRALRTAEIVADVLEMTDLLETADALRAERDAASIRDWLAARTESRLMLVGHNPSLTDLVGLLITGEPGPGALRAAQGGRGRPARRRRRRHAARLAGSAPDLPTPLRTRPP